MSGSSARYLHDLLTKMITKATTETDSAMMKKARLQPNSLPDVMYCHLLQVQHAVSDMGTLILKAATLYTSRVRDPWNHVETIVKLFEVKILNSKFEYIYFCFRVLIIDYVRDVCTPTIVSPHSVSSLPKFYVRYYSMSALWSWIFLCLSGYVITINLEQAFLHFFLRC